MSNQDAEAAGERVEALLAGLRSQAGRRPRPRPRSW